MTDFDYKKLCTPAKIYFALAVLSAIMMLIKRASMMAVLIKLVGAFIWTVVLGWLCKKGFTIISWGLVLLPFVMMFFENNNRYSSELLESLTSETPAWNRKSR